MSDGPILVEVIEAEIRIKTEIPALKVWAVNAEVFAGVVPPPMKTAYCHSGWVKSSLRCTT